MKCLALRVTFLLMLGAIFGGITSTPMLQALQPFIQQKQAIWLCPTGSETELTFVSKPTFLLIY